MTTEWMEWALFHYATQDRLNETIHAKIQRLERPSMSSIYQPSQSLYSRLSNRYCHCHCDRKKTNSRASSSATKMHFFQKILWRFRESLINDFEDAGDQDNVFEDEMEKESMNNVDEKENTDIEDDLYPELSLTDNSDLLARPPKIWISKTASMEHDLDWSSIPSHTFRLEMNFSSGVINTEQQTYSGYSLQVWKVLWRNRFLKATMYIKHWYWMEVDNNIINSES